MAGSSVTFTYEKFGPIKKVIADFVTDSATGDCNDTTGNVISGRLIKIVTDPGSPAPSANWDVLVKDSKDLDVLATCQNAAALLARHTANTEQTYLHVLNNDASAIGIAAYPIVSDKLKISVANGGNSKAGQIILYVDGEIIGSQ